MATKSSLLVSILFFLCISATLLLLIRGQEEEYSRQNNSRISSGGNFHLRRHLLKNHRLRPHDDNDAVLKQQEQPQGIITTDLFGNLVEVAVDDSPPQHQDGSSSTITATNNFKETRIINGDTVHPSSYPFYVQMIKPYICGGSLITPNIILTAQHCVEEDKTTYHWKFWDVNLKTFKYYSSKNIVRHPGYNDWLENDIALVVLDNPILPVATTTDAWELNGTYDWKNAPPIIGIQRYASPSGCTSVTREEAYDMTTFQIIGYGVDETDKGVVDDLQMAEIHYVSNEECNDQYGKGWVTEDMMCATDVKETQDSCQGDSGGPMLARLSVDGQMLLRQVGAVSWGIDCAHPEYPGVYARVAYQANWIDQQVCKVSGKSCKEDENGVMRIIDYALEAVVRTSVSRRARESNPNTNAADRALKRNDIIYGVFWEEEVCELLGGSVDEPPNPITGSPTHAPSDAPSMTPTISRNPTHAPIGEPSMAPSTSFPTKAPMIEPSMAPSSSPTAFPSVSPSGSPSRPPGKSETKTYTTEKKGSLKTKAFMFEIVANDGIDVIIETLMIEPKDPTKMTEVTVYYREGSYKDFEGEGLIEADWGDPVYAGVPQLDADGMSVIELDDPITIPSGETGSFYIAGKKEFWVIPADPAQMRSVTTEDFDINSGQIMKKQFEPEVRGGGEFAGKVMYFTYTARVTPPPSMSPSMSKRPTLPPIVVTSPPSKSPTKPPTSAPTNLPTNLPTNSPSSQTNGVVDNGSPKVYQTHNADDPDSNAKGLMFSIVTKSKAITITDLGIIGKKSGDKDVSIYYKLGAYSMNEDNDWTQVLKGKVSLVQEQIVKVTLDEEIVIPAGETASVYIYSKNGQLCTKAKEGDSTEADDFMLIAGWITKNEFEDLVEDKWGEFEGEIFYLSG